jgi:hypothetical protein
MREWPGEHRIDLVEQLVDFGSGRDRMKQRLMPGAVGAANDPVVEHRDDPDSRLPGPQEDAGLGVNAFLGYH